MSEQPKLPPTTAIEADDSLRAKTENWFEYPIRVYPHHTDYAGVVWHGSYIAWMEEARVECLRSIGIDIAELVALGCELPVVELAIRYHQAMTLGTEAILKTRMHERKGVRINWDQQIQSLTGHQLYMSAQVTLVAVDRKEGKIMKRLPPSFNDALVRLVR